MNANDYDSPGDNKAAVYITQAEYDARGTVVIRCCEHDSDCAVHNAPFMPIGPCDCSISEPVSEGAAVITDEVVAWRWRDNIRPGLTWFLTDSADWAKQLGELRDNDVEPLYRRIEAVEPSSRRCERRAGLSLVRQTLSLFRSAINCGESWSATCEKCYQEALDELEKAEVLI